MNAERDKFLTEAMGECWHDEIQKNSACLTCGAPANGYRMGMFGQKSGWLYYKTKRNNFSTPDGFFKLWEWVEKQEWRNDFMAQPFSLREMINPDRFANAVYEFMKELK